MTTETNTTPKNDLPEVYIDDILMSLKYFTDEQQAHLKLLTPRSASNVRPSPAFNSARLELTERRMVVRCRLLSRVAWNAAPAG